MIRRLIGAMLVLCAGIVWPPDAASAHVLVTDQTRSIGAIVHVTPADDPVAGQQATLYFEVQPLPAGASVKDISLSVQTPDGRNDQVGVQVNDTLGTAAYTFVQRGTYHLTVRVGTSLDTYIFTHSQRVTRGAAAGTTQTQTHAWAEVALLASGVGFVLLAITAWHWRNAIIQQSHW